MSYILAIDGGGSKTKVLSADSSGNVLKQGLSGPTSLAVTSIGAASFNLKEGIRQAIDGLNFENEKAVIVMGLAGMDTIKEKNMAEKVFTDAVGSLQVEAFVIVNDIVIALESGTRSQDAVALISGTGSHCFGRNSAGQFAKTGGMDYLLTDQGSGYQIGLSVLKTAVKSYDGRIEKSLIEQLVCQHFHIKTIDGLKAEIYNPTLGKTEIAALSQIATQAFEAGDRVAQVIFDQAIEELYLMVSTVLKRLNLLEVETAIDCVLAGSMTKVSYIHDQLITKLKYLCPNLTIIFPEKEPVYGALSLAIEYINKHQVSS